MDAGAQRFIAAVATAYPDAETGLIGTKVAWADGGPDPLDLVGYAFLDDPVPHWHVVGYGLSAPDPGDDPGRGWSFELSTRVRRDPDEDQLLPWVFNWLQNQARYVAESGNTLAPGDQMPANEPIREDSGSDLVAMLYRVDPVLDPLVDPQIVQVIGVTEDELRAKRTWQFQPLIALLERELGAELIVDLERRSVLADPSVAAEVAEGARRDGSSTASLLVERLEVRTDPPTLGIDTHLARDLGLLVASRLGHGRDLTVTGSSGTVMHIAPADRVGLVATGGGHWRLDLTPAAASWLDSRLSASPGVWSPPELAPLVVDVAPVDVD